MSFNVLFMAHAPEADSTKHRSKIETDRFRLLTVVVPNQAEALATAREAAEEEAIDSILLCPGFTHQDVAEIYDALGGDVAVSVARGDGPSNRISAAARRRAGYVGT